MKSLTQLISSIALTLILFSGCAKQPEATKEVKIDPTLPVLSINGYLADMNAVAFEWKPIQDARVEGIYVYRSNPETGDGKLHRIDAIEQRAATHYTDTNVVPGTAYQYRFSSYMANGHESQASETISVNTLPVISSVSFFESIGNMPRSAKLIWRPHTNIKVKGYQIERQTLEDPEWNVLAYIDHRLSAEYIDSGLKDNHVYKYRLRAVTYDKLVSTPSNIVKVVTKPLPNPVTNLTTTTDLPQKITLNWDASSAPDFSHYNIYRSTSATRGFDYHVKLKETTFTDTVKEDGASYFYKVTVVDSDGLESPRDTVAMQGTTLHQPKTPVITDAQVINGAATLHWKNNDVRTASYVLIKTTKKSWIDKSIQEIKNIKETQFTDVDIAADTVYLYQVVAVDQYGVRSKPSIEAELSFSAER